MRSICLLDFVVIVDYSATSNASAIAQGASTASQLSAPSPFISQACGCSESETQSLFPPLLSHFPTRLLCCLWVGRVPSSVFPVLPLLLLRMTVSCF